MVAGALRRVSAWPTRSNTSYFESADPADLTVLTDADRAGVVRSHLDLAASRAPGTDVVRVTNPHARDRRMGIAAHRHLDRHRRPVRSSSTASSELLARDGYEVHLLLHPVVDGTLFVHAEINRESDPAILDALRAAIESVIADVHVGRRRLASDA